MSRPLRPTMLVIGAWMARPEGPERAVPTLEIVGVRELVAAIQAA
jgi:hypothetical protein